MEANELRIGNYVCDDIKDHKTFINAKDIYEIALNNNKHSYIPLTEEWLVKFGFEIEWIISHKEEYFNLFQKGDVYFYSADAHHHTSEEIKYVHQLQNLYFALTGKELTYGK